MGIGNLLTAPELTDKNLLPGEGTWIPVLTLIFMAVSAIYLWIAYRRYFKTPDEEEEISSLFIEAEQDIISNIGFNFDIISPYQYLKYMEGIISNEIDP